jgi:hypothetical protein
MRVRVGGFGEYLVCFEPLASNEAGEEERLGPDPDPGPEEPNPVHKWRSGVPKPRFRIGRGEGRLVWSVALRAGMVEAGQGARDSLGPLDDSGGAGALNLAGSYTFPSPSPASSAAPQQREGGGGGSVALFWSGGHVAAEDLRKLAVSAVRKGGPRARVAVNHFPGSTELTRKDRMAVNLRAFVEGQAHRGADVFVPKTFFLPEGFAALADEWRGTGALQRWIVKPANLSRGRGVYLLTSLDDLAQAGPCVVSRYVDNPLTLDGFKFDLRIYVLVTSFVPLVAYVHGEGLARFATERYSNSLASLDNAFVHLTNYSINKESGNYVKNRSADRDDFGNKWSLPALRRHLAARHGEPAVAALFSRIDDLVVKSLIAVEGKIGSASSGSSSSSSAASAFSNASAGASSPFSSSPSIASSAAAAHAGPLRHFELFGYDVLIDANWSPWLLEVNLSPSLGTDSPLDLAVKSKVVADALNIVGIRAGDYGRRDAHPSSTTSASTAAAAPAHGGLGDARALLTRFTDEFRIAASTGFRRVYPAQETVSWYLPMFAFAFFFFFFFFFFFTKQYYL